MPKDRYSEEEVQRILQNAIRADTDALAESDFSVDDVRRIAGELGIDIARLDFRSEMSNPEADWQFGFVRKVTFRARTQGDPELIFERALGVLRNHFKLISQVSLRPRGRERINIHPDTRCRLSIVDDGEAVIIEYQRDFAGLNAVFIFLAFGLLAIPTAASFLKTPSPFDPALTAVLKFVVIYSILVMLAHWIFRLRNRRWMDQEEALWRKILSER